LSRWRRIPQADFDNLHYCVAPAGATAMSTIGVFTLSALTGMAPPVGKYIE
jgi:hypothetical protein